MTASGSEPVQNGSVGPGGEESFDYQHIMKMMHGLEPEKASMAGDLFSNLADKLESLRGALKTAGEQAGDKWSGSAAESAMKHIQQLHDQTAQLAAQSRTTGNTMHWLGGDVMPKFAQIPDPQVATGWEKVVSEGAQGVVTGKGGIAEAANGGPGKSKANSAAQDYLKTFNGHLQTANNAMPKSLATPPGNKGSLPWSTTAGSHSGAGSGGGTGAGTGSASVPGASVPGGATGVPGYSSPSSANPFTAAKSPNGGSVPSSTGSLQGYTPPSAGTTAPPVGAGMPSATGGGSANPFARAPMMPGGGSGFGGTRGASEEISPKENVPEESLSKGSAPGEEAAGAESGGSEAARAAGAEGEGSSGMPMGAGGGGGGSNDKERQRQAWMNEDQSIWGLPDEEIGSTIG